MHFAGSLGRACAALFLLTACGAEASTPAPVWSGLARVNILCLVQSDSGIVQGQLHDSLCKSVRDAAAVGAPAPVQIIAAGDPAVLSPDSVTLLAHGSVQGGPAERQLVFSIRPFRSATEAMLFSAAPRAVPLSGRPGRNSELEAAIGATLSATLPWLNRPAGPKPIN